MAQHDEKVALRSDLSSTSASPEPFDPVLFEKEERIREACTWRDADKLRSLAQSQGGLLKDELRQQAWPILMGLSGLGDADEKHDHISSEWETLPPHRDESQVELDVNRSFVYYPHDQSDRELDRRKAELSALITQVLRENPYLCYFQGYHDICQVILLVLAPELRAPVVARLSVLRIRDFMLPSLAPTTAQLRLLPDILSVADPKLWRHLLGVEPFYALSGTLTMFAHNIEAYSDIARLFDVFLAREPVFSIYMFAQIVLDRRDEIFEIDEPDMLHVILGKVPPRMDLDALIVDSASLLERHPPEKLRAWRGISRSSSLKTVRHVEDCAKQTLTDGQHFFEAQATELQRAEMRDRVKAKLWAYRKPARTVGAAFAFGILAMYLRRNPGIVHQIVGLFMR
ncbi:rab-GTPase-TBC domain-containing protein [Emericellopsis atlantica]|uniref:Rab-GTPase-TBC domain-containing protein n=1 Tax=Emericellopsis atlantica TaxID=2614577 RepID=A0A9P7ZTC9_9HYPO|nr:rab-GTPase-TBC domain-containing protein [Emericellopsis atlantica]KAG9257330.1 rab-GTPase-TBC domain-containing protein [Emericellopsis atlantica]